MAGKWECGFDYPNGIACWMGNIASFCFFIVYIPQFLLNEKRKSVTGFSLSSTAFKLVGSSFLCVNSLFNGSGFPVFLYGFLNTFQHALFLVQFFRYSTSKSALLYMLIPVIPYILAKYFPKTMKYTDLVKPICQVVSHIPQLAQCIRLHTTTGCSMMGQHLNFIGSIFGIIMCYLENEESLKTWVIYFNSGFQAISMYLVAIWYHEMRFFDVTKKTKSEDGISRAESIV